MTTWNEADHPRDDEGKFTFKNGGVSNKESYEDKMQRRADILYPTMKDKLPKVNYDNIGLGLGNFVKEKLSREDILFPSMKDKKEIIKEEPNIEQIKINKKDIGYVTGGAAGIQGINKEYIENLKNMAQTDSDKKFLNSLDYILDCEKGYNNIKGDKPTNLGVTQDIYNIYRKEKGLPSQNVRKINIKEATQIYYKYFWKPSNADKLQHPLDLAYFDMYINSNPREAKNVLNRSNNDVYKFLENRRKFYDDVIKSKPIKEKFRKGWYNRLDNLKKYIDEYYASIK